MSEMVDWLLEQIEEDKQRARELRAEVARTLCTDHGHINQEGGLRCRTCVRRADAILSLPLFNPDRVLAECEAKLQIIAQHRPTTAASSDLTYPASAGLCVTCGPGDTWEVEQQPYGQVPCATLRLLALPLADHPGYRAEWAPA